MDARSTALRLASPLFFAALTLVPALALATPPDDASPPSPEVAPSPDVVEPVVITAAAEPAAETPVEGPAPDYEMVEEPISNDYYEPEPYEPYQPKHTTLELDSGYFSFGIAPGVTPHHKGFHPNTRFELEFGGTLEHDYRDLGLSFGVATHVTPYYERKAPSFGADVTSTAMIGPFYVRTGLGAVGGLPRGHLLHKTAPGIGGVIGIGLNFGREPMVRVGVDYDLRINTKLEPVHTFFLSFRIACCRDD